MAKGILDDDARVTCNLAWIVVDMLECALVDLKQNSARCGVPLERERARHFNTAIKSVHMLMSDIRAMDKEQQCAFGNDADMLYQTIKLICDRCGDDDVPMADIYTYIENMPSRLGINVKQYEKFAFMKMTDGNRKND